MTGTDGEESVWCQAKMTRNGKLLIGYIYRSPNSTATNDAKINDALKKASNLGFSHVLIFGDLSHPSLNWHENTSTNDGNYPSIHFRNEQHYIEYRRASNRVKTEVRKAVRDFKGHIAREAKANPKSFYKYASER